jgi:hypothetical protein
LKASFGSVKLFGRTYEKDIVVHVDGSVTKRKKKMSKPYKPVYGHTPLSGRELGFLEEEKPEVVFVGTGYESALPITEDAQRMLAKFKTIIMPTPDVVEEIEHGRNKMVAIIHVTC